MLDLISILSSLPFRPKSSTRNTKMILSSTFIILDDMLSDVMPNIVKLYAPKGRIPPMTMESGARYRTSM